MTEWAESKFSDFGVCPLEKAFAVFPDQSVALQGFRREPLSRFDFESVSQSEPSSMLRHLELLAAASFALH